MQVLFCFCFFLLFFFLGFGFLVCFFCLLWFCFFCFFIFFVKPYILCVVGLIRLETCKKPWFPVNLTWNHPSDCYHMCKAFFVYCNSEIQQEYKLGDPSSELNVLNLQNDVPANWNVLSVALMHLKKHKQRLVSFALSLIPSFPCCWVVPLAGNIVSHMRPNLGKYPLQSSFFHPDETQHDTSRGHHHLSWWNLWTSKLSLDIVGRSPRPHIAS